MPSVGPFGSTGGTSEGPAGYSTPVTKLVAYANASYIFGIKLYWGTSNYMYGHTNGLTGVTFDLTDDPVCTIKYETASGLLRGLKFSTPEDRHLEIGVTPSTSTAFSNTAYAFTDMTTYKGSVNGVVIIWGITLQYIDTSSQFQLTRCLGELAWPAMSVMAHVYVVAQSFFKVGKLRTSLSIKAPSCDPPLTTSPSDSQLWYRTFRAQENCKEMFLIYFPSILVASTMGYQAFGKWAPRAVGTLSFLGAVFRYKYLNAYIADADLRGKPFYYASLCMKPVFFLAVVSSGYLLGKELYHCAKTGCCSKSGDASEEKDE